MGVIHSILFTFDKGKIYSQQNKQIWGFKTFESGNETLF